MSDTWLIIVGTMLVVILSFVYKGNEVTNKKLRK